MSQENVEIVREAHRAFNAHDLDRFVEFWHPDCEFRPGLEGAFEGAGGVYRGHEGIRRWWQTMHAAFPEMSTEIEDLRELEDGGLLVSIVLHMRAEATDIGFDVPVFQLVTIRGRIASSRDFLDRAAALEAAGLSE